MSQETHQILSSTRIFNATKTSEEYKNTPIFCGPEPGLMDTIHKPFPKLWDLYKELKSNDWDEQEFDHTRCNLDFKNAHEDISYFMINTLFFQWNADSVAGRSILSIMDPFVSSTEYWTCLTRIADNENIHGATYSEIVRMSFDNPHKVIIDCLQNQEALKRLSIVERTLSEADKLSSQYAAGLIKMSDELYRDVCIKTTIILLFLERLQFMASFAVTFTICSTGLFQSIGTAVQKICQDELEIHAEFDKEVLNYEMKTEKGKSAINSLKDWISDLCDEVIQAEFDFIDYLYKDNRSVPGLSADILRQWVLFNAKDIVKFLNIDTGDKYKFPKQNPMPHIEAWFDVSKRQIALQESDAVAYKVGIVRDDAEDEIFDY